MKIGLTTEKGCTTNPLFQIVVKYTYSYHRWWFCFILLMFNLETWGRSFGNLTSNTVDGSEIRRSPPCIYETLWKMGCCPYQLSVNSINKGFNCVEFTHRKQCFASGLAATWRVRIPSSSPTDLSEKGVLLGSNPLAHCWLMIGWGLF